MLCRGVSGRVPPLPVLFTQLSYPVLDKVIGVTGSRGTGAGVFPYIRPLLVRLYMSIPVITLESLPVSTTGGVGGVSPWCESAMPGSNGELRLVHRSILPSREWTWVQRRYADIEGIKQDNLVHSIH